jgi:hypothetical protein
LGASRGGLSTKLHLRTDGTGRPLVLLVTQGQRHEVTQLERLLDGGAVKRTGPDGRPGHPGRRPHLAMTPLRTGLVREPLDEALDRLHGVDS